MFCEKCGAACQAGACASCLRGASLPEELLASIDLDPEAAPIRDQIVSVLVSLAKRGMVTFQRAESQSTEAFGQHLSEETSLEDIDITEIWSEDLVTRPEIVAATIQECALDINVDLGDLVSDLIELDPQPTRSDESPTVVSLIEGSREEPHSRPVQRLSLEAPGGPPWRASSPPASERASNVLAAQKLHAQSLIHRDQGDDVSALENIKLALVLDRGNREYVQLCEELSARVFEITQGASPAARAATLFEGAIHAEAANDIDEAIRLLQEAINLSKTPQYLNRLGVIFAARKHEPERALNLLEAACRLAPAHKTYRKNLEHIESLLAANTPSSAKPRERSESRGIFSRFLKRS
jgi:tetratricopeptide (TPR) repeat protein